MLADLHSIHSRTQSFFHIKGGNQAILKPVSEIQAQVLCTIMGCLIVTFVCILTSCNETKEVLGGNLLFISHTSLILPFIMTDEL